MVSQNEVRDRRFRRSDVTAPPIHRHLHADGIIPAPDRRRGRVYARTTDRQEENSSRQAAGDASERTACAGASQRDFGVAVERRPGSIRTVRGGPRDGPDRPRHFGAAT